MDPMRKLMLLLLFLCSFGQRSMSKMEVGERGNAGNEHLPSVQSAMNRSERRGKKRPMNCDKDATHFTVF